ncbi:MAG: putative phosphotransferase related to Ser/Thr protein kinase [Candidatus Accumulibacter regalis]|jgi:aminoglycoside/choline kinase family phosphotransferase|uniref:Phosphotransferase related to Ser/Thr protein kinase n=1 Tax=Accumulibacter regalis TaxID=522306 RepID=A0A011PLU3_ACCRE|nr:MULTISPECIES: phosphotransferase [unclassified Candidatus Accumulibacter]EXI88441.1 MAG: putative phosphotransferase related to Ser/Thr protein kinase [Candidatus Accumulibacter regalis]MBL8367771.1 phosphotransferase [Accumulibacter sp.]MBN8513106.1 phosphotransferase [Accumulibacter sp.]MBO3703772.1 phosphotransferase [Accumulibacter sp.]HRE71060.1 phosphotransferase [Accumulibacter sp.]
MPRTALLRNWLRQVFEPTFPGWDARLEAASADASFRRYFRVELPDRTTRIVMDAPPEKEDCRPFIKVAALFREAEVHLPAVLAADLEQGFLLLSDLGSSTYLSALHDRSTAARLYADANRALLAIQLASRPGVLPEYDGDLLGRELALFPDWYLRRHLGVTIDKGMQSTLQTVFAAILANNLRQPRVYVHRDYHSRNLMLVGEPAPAFPSNPGILDFQDAVYGPLTYDLVSLYRDAYIAWPEDQELDFVIRYWEGARQAGLPVEADFHDFYRDYEWMGVQRQLKVLGIFARLCHRDGKENYLADMPRVLGYLRRSCERYRELRPLARLLDVVEKRPVDVGYSF